MNIAIVTGASSGMGKDFVRELDAYGFDEIWAIARREGALCELAREVKTPVRVLALDLTERESLGKIEELLEADISYAPPDTADSARMPKSMRMKARGWFRSTARPLCA